MAKLRVYIENWRGQRPAYHINNDVVTAALGAVLDRADVSTHHVDNPDRAALSQADIFISGVLDPVVLRGLDRLKIVHCTNAGIERYLPLDWLPPGAVLTNASGIHAAKAAEFGLMAVLMLNDAMPAHVANQRRHVWDQTMSTTVRGKHALIYGAGALGDAVGGHLKLLGVNVSGIRRSGEPTANIARMHRPSELRALLPSVDFLVLACPLTPETRGAIGAAEINLLKRGAGIVNIARAAVMDYDALAAALHSGQVGGAVLDVFAQEPLPADSPWWDAPNTLVIPHVSSDDPSTYIVDALGIARENIARLTEGRPLVNVVQSDRGY